MTNSPTIRAKIGEFAIDTATIDDASTQILERIAHIYCRLQPEQTVDDFMVQVYVPLAASSADQPANIEFKYSRAHSEQSYAALMKFLVTACMHCIEADKSDEGTNQAKAWTHIANAMYHLGLLESMVIIEPALEHIIASRAAKGARMRSDKREPLREYARKLAAERPFKSKRQAALTIRDAVLQKAKSDGIPLSEMQAEYTISGWLKNMSFGSKHES